VGALLDRIVCNGGVRKLDLSYFSKKTNRVFPKTFIWGEKILSKESLHCLKACGREGRQTPVKPETTE